MAIEGLTVLLARALVAVELARREALRTEKDEAYELTFAEKALTRGITKHKAHEGVDAQAFQMQVEVARRGFEGMPA